MNRPDVTISRDWVFPAPAVHRLDNGLRVWAFQLPGQHVIAAELVMAAGVSAEPRDIEGVATVALRTCDEGTFDHPDGLIGELLESQGALVHGHQGHYTSRLRLEVPSTRLLAALPLFAELLRRPQMADDDIRHQIDVLIAEHAQRVSSPRGLNSLAFRQALYAPSDRRTRPESGVPRTISAITAEDAASFQRRFWGPSGATLVIAGDLPSGTLPTLTDVFGDWVPQTVVPDVRPLLVDSPRILLVDRPDAVQADVLIGCYTIGRDDPRFPAVSIAGRIMAGAFTSRLNLALREDRGYSYGVQGGFSPGRYGGSFNVSTSLRTDIAADAIALALDLLALSEPFTPAEVAAARDYHLGVGPLANETASDIADQAVHLVDGRAAISYLHALDDTVASLTPDAVTSAYRELISPDRLSMAITGPASVLVPQLAGRGIDAEVIDLAY